MLRRVLLGLSLLATAFCVLLAYLAYAALAMIVELSGSYIKFGVSGVHTLDTHLQRTGHADVRLVGMMHFGATDSYNSLYRSFSKPSSLILEEGISDSARPARSSYKCAETTRINMARSVIPQPSLCIIESAHRVASISQAQGSQGIDIVNADVYLQDMSPPTQAWIKQSLGLLEQIIDGDLSGLDWRLLLEQLSDSIPEQVWDDILYARNDKLVDSFTQAGDYYDHVVIPWGAMHGPGIQQSLLQLGYEETHREYRLILPWKALLQARSSAGK